MSERYFGFPALVVEPGVKTGLPILYDNPKEVGADRIADAVAAFDLFGGPTIVVDFGTATTFEAISAKGEYLGGAIFPGIDISLDALFARAAALRRVELVEPRTVIGRSTVESMQSGAIYGYTSLVDGMCERIRERARRRCDRRRHRRAVRPHRTAVHRDQPRRALAHPPRPAPDLREERRRMTTPYRFEPTTSAAALRATYDGLEAGEETGEVVTVAGRVMLHRGQGKLAFADAARRQRGEMQLFALAAVTDDFDGLRRASASATGSAPPARS